MDKSQNFSTILRKFSFPIIVFAIGLMGLIAYINSIGLPNKQTNLFLLASLGLIFTSLVLFYFSMSTKLSKGITILFTLLFGLVSVYYALNLRSTIQNEVLYNKDVEKHMDIAKQSLLDLKILETAYKKKYFKYTDNFDTLKSFAKTEKINILVLSEGDVPRRKMTLVEANKLGYRYIQPWTESDAVKLGLIKRVYDDVPVYEYLFSSERVNQKDRVFDFEIDKLEVYRKLDESKNSTIKIETAQIDSTLAVKFTTPPPYGSQRKNDPKGVLSIGSITELKMNSSWSKE